MATGVNEFALEGSIEYKERGFRRLLKKKKKKLRTHLSLSVPNSKMEK